MTNWLAQGRSLGASLRRFNCIVVAGPSTDATADVAIGIAEAQAGLRRVVLGDLLGDAVHFAPLRSDDDPHGLADAFHYGISLARIARPVTSTPGLLFAPTGSHLVDYAEILGHGRWARLIASFVELDELFIVAVPLGAAGIEELVVRSDGLVLVDGQAPAKIDPERVIARVQSAPPVTVPSKPVPRPSTAAGAPPPPVRTPPAPPSATPPKQVATKRVPGLSRPVIVGSLLTLVGALFVYWVADEFGDRRSIKPAVVSALLKATPAGSAQAAPNPNVIDPADSGSDAYAVQLMAANTQAGAILKLQEHVSSLPAATYAPVAIQGKMWFKVLVGAFPTRGGADSLLISLRANRQLDSTEGVVVRVPYGIRLDDEPDSPNLGDALASLRVGRNLPAYPLYQPNKRVWVMVGAFETRSQADLYAQTLRSIGLTPELVFRQGRTY